MFQIRRCADPLVNSVSQPLSLKIEGLTSELHKLKSELALVEIENSKLIEKIEDIISNEQTFKEKVEIFFEDGMTSHAIVNMINSTENLTGYIDYVPDEGSLATGKVFLNMEKIGRRFYQSLCFCKEQTWEELGL